MSDLKLNISVFLCLYDQKITVVLWYYGLCLQLSIIIKCLRQKNLLYLYYMSFSIILTFVLIAGQHSFCYLVDTCACTCESPYY